MSRRAHAAIAIAIEFSGFLLGFAISWIVFDSPFDEDGSWTWRMLYWPLPVFAVPIALRFLFRSFVPAQCPNCQKAQAYLEGRKPWIYVCHACGNVHETSVSDGGGPSYPEEAESIERES